MKTILVVDDKEINQVMAKDLLEGAGYSVILADTGLDSIDLALTHNPDLILMDMGLPDISGYEACQRLKTNPHTKEIVLVGYTAHTMDDEIDKALESGCVGVISKPINISEFCNQVNAYLSNKPAHKPSQVTLKLPHKPQRNVKTQHFSKMLSKMSHDLNTPAIGIQRFCQLLKSSDNLNEEDIQLVMHIESLALESREKVKDATQELKIVFDKEFLRPSFSKAEEILPFAKAN